MPEPLRLSALRYVANCLACIILLVGNAAFGQSMHSAARHLATNSGESRMAGLDPSSIPLRRFVPRSIVGGELGHANLDPWMRPDVELAIERFLERDDFSNWNGMTIRDMAHYVGQQIPVYLDEMELDAIGVDPDSMITGEIPYGCLATRLTLALWPAELSFQIRGGCLILTSMDTAELTPEIRLYDIEPLVVRATPQGSVLRDLQIEQSITMLGDAIQMHIDPESWLSAGGTSAITAVATPTRLMLMVSAPTETQLQITEFLRTMIRSELVGPFDDALARRRGGAKGTTERQLRSASIPGMQFNSVPSSSASLPRLHLQLQKIKLGMSPRNP